MKSIIEKIIRKLKFIFIYLFINLRRYLTEKKINKIHNNELLDNGFVKFNSNNGKALADYLSEIIRDPENCESSTLGKFKIAKKCPFGVRTIDIDSSSEFLHKYVFKEEILEKLKNFYGKDFYLRNNPTLEFSYDNEKHNSQIFHLDFGLKQTSVMINLNKLDENSTHMEYLKKSNKQYKFINPNRFSRRETNKVEKCYKNLQTVKTIGEIGEISIFDAGCGYHRQISGKRRVMMHLNFTENLAFSYWNINWKPSNFSYWFSDTGQNLNLKNKIFDLVQRRLKSNFFVPRIYNVNYYLNK